MLTNGSRKLILMFTSVLVLGMVGGTAKRANAAANSGVKYMADSNTVQRMTLAEANEVLSNTLKDRPDIAGGRRVKLLNGSIHGLKDDLNKAEVLMEEIKEIKVVGNSDLVFVGEKGTSVTLSLRDCYAIAFIYSDSAIVGIKDLYTIASLNSTYAKQFVDAIFVLHFDLYSKEVNKKSATESENSKQKIIDFENAAQTYRNAKNKPIFPEDARMFKVQAENAVRDKNFAEAAKLYEKASGIAPWWPEGHFNRALVLGEVGDFITAISEMNRYLRLAPNAPNARAAQDKIYGWAEKAIAPGGNAIHYKSPQMVGAMDYVHHQKGKGTRRILMGNEAELMDTAAKTLVEAHMAIIREPHAFFAVYNDKLVYAFYFYPSKNKKHTEVEILVASPWFDNEMIKKFQSQSFLSFFTSGYINMRLLEKGYDPNMKDEGMLPLSYVGMKGDKTTAIKLINRGANKDLAINELKEFAFKQVPHLNSPPNKEIYDKANMGIEMLNGLKQEEKRN